MPPMPDKDQPETRKEQARGLYVGCAVHCPLPAKLSFVGIQSRAIKSISMRTSLGSLDTCTVDRAGGWVAK